MTSLHAILILTAVIAAATVFARWYYRRVDERYRIEVSRRRAVQAFAILGGLFGSIASASQAANAAMWRFGDAVKEVGRDE